MRFGKTARKLDFTACAANECMMQFDISLDLIRESAANITVEAKTVAMNGATIDFTINPEVVEKVFDRIAE